VRLIVGLGNPGSKYAGTRHNVGFRVIDLLAGRCGVQLGIEKFRAWFARASIGDQEVVLLKPTTFVNRSGQAVVAAGRFYRIELADLLVVLDDLALPLGKIRMRASGSAGGHNGLQDIVDRLGSTEFARLRVGIDPPAGDPVSYVLTRFSEPEEAQMAAACERAADAVQDWVGRGIEFAMNRYNPAPKGQENQDP
jgi:PTH1 family peptidyl-tRNA hydrolase